MGRVVECVLWSVYCGVCIVECVLWSVEYNARGELRTNTRVAIGGVGGSTVGD